MLNKRQVQAFAAIPNYRSLTYIKMLKPFFEYNKGL